MRAAGRARATRLRPRLRAFSAPRVPRGAAGGVFLQEARLRPICSGRRVVSARHSWSVTCSRQFPSASGCRACRIASAICSGVIYAPLLRRRRLAPTAADEQVGTDLFADTAPLLGALVSASVKGAASPVRARVRPCCGSGAIRTPRGDLARSTPRASRRARPPMRTAAYSPTIRRRDGRVCDILAHAWSDGTRQLLFHRSGRNARSCKRATDLARMQD